MRLLQNIIVCCYPNMSTKWKKQLVDGLPEIFSNGRRFQNKEKEHEKLMASLYQKIGQLEVELDWVKKGVNVPFNYCDERRHRGTNVLPYKYSFQHTRSHFLSLKRPQTLV